MKLWLPAPSIAITDSSLVWATIAYKIAPQNTPPPQTPFPPTPQYLHPLNTSTPSIPPPPQYPPPPPPPPPRVPVIHAELIFSKGWYNNTVVNVYLIWYGMKTWVPNFYELLAKLLL